MSASMLFMALGLHVLDSRMVPASQGSHLSAQLAYKLLWAETRQANDLEQGKDTVKIWV